MVPNNEIFHQYLITKRNQMKFGISVHCVCQACKSKERETKNKGIEVKNMVIYIQKYKIRKCIQ